MVNQYCSGDKLCGISTIDGRLAEHEQEKQHLVFSSSLISTQMSISRRHDVLDGFIFINHPYNIVLLKKKATRL
jgi:hypothetical protein